MGKLLVMMLLGIGFKKKPLRGNGGTLTIACYMKILNNFVVKVDF
jgi:hypothetical protein